MRQSDIGGCLLVRGDVVKLEMQDGRIFELPDDFGIVHDPTGEVCHRCDVYLTRYAKGNPLVVPMSHPMAAIVSAYFGDMSDLSDGSVDIPNGPWHRVGRVVRIYYARYGTQKALYQHPFAEPVDLYKQSRGEAYLLSLPDGCIIDSHGFVWP